MNPVVHFEMPAENLERAMEFYRKAFSWNMQMMGPEMGNYVLAGTAETDEKGMVKTPGTINGGFFKRMDDESVNIPSVVISVENIDTAIENIKAAGGTLLGEKMDIPGIGVYVSFKDTENNRVGVMQPAKM